jgi:hypothetical protein
MNSWSGIPATMRIYSSVAAIIYSRKHRLEQLKMSREHSKMDFKTKKIWMCPITQVKMLLSKKHRNLSTAIISKTIKIQVNYRKTKVILILWVIMPNRNRLLRMGRTKGNDKHFRTSSFKKWALKMIQLLRYLVCKAQTATLMVRV